MLAPHANKKWRLLISASSSPTAALVFHWPRPLTALHDGLDLMKSITSHASLARSLISLHVLTVLRITQASGVCLIIDSDSACRNDCRYLRSKFEKDRGRRGLSLGVWAVRGGVCPVRTPSVLDTLHRKPMVCERSPSATGHESNITMVCRA